MIIVLVAGDSTFFKSLHLIWITCHLHILAFGRCEGGACCCPYSPHRLCHSSSRMSRRMRGMALRYSHSGLNYSDGLWTIATEVEVLCGFSLPCTTHRLMLSHGRGQYGEEGCSSAFEALGIRECGALAGGQYKKEKKERKSEKKVLYVLL